MDDRIQYGAMNAVFDRKAVEEVCQDLGVALPLDAYGSPRAKGMLERLHLAFKAPVSGQQPDDTGTPSPLGGFGDDRQKAATFTQAEVALFVQDFIKGHNGSAHASPVVGPVGGGEG